MLQAVSTNMTNQVAQKLEQVTKSASLQLPNAGKVYKMATGLRLAYEPAYGTNTNGDTTTPSLSSGVATRTLQCLPALLSALWVVRCM